MKTYTISGKVINRQTTKGITDLRVEAWDKDLIFDDFVGVAITKRGGKFTIRFDENYFKEIFTDRSPDIFFKVFLNDELLSSTEESVIWNMLEGNSVLIIEVDIDGRSRNYKMDFRLRRLMQMTDGEIVKAQDTENKRLNEATLKINNVLSILPNKTTQDDKMVVERIRNQNIAELTYDPILGPITIDPSKLKPIKIRAIVKFAGNRDDLSKLGLEISSRSQDIYTVIGTKAQIAALASQPATLRLQLPRRLVPNVEQAAKQAEISDVQKKRPTNPFGYVGKGVIVGIIDYNLDITHHAFRKPSGTHGSRLLYYWVQRPDNTNAPGQTPAQLDPIAFVDFNRGRLYTQASIDAALNQTGSPYGSGANQISKAPGQREHGTHVTGIAAGSGHMADWNKIPEHVGAAPQADIIYVCYGFDKSKQYPTWESALEDSILEGIGFIMAAAEKHNKPVVINVSLGGQFGPHNGTTLFDQARDNLINSYQRRCIIWAAGNDNDDKCYKEGSIKPGAVETLVLNVNLSHKFDFTSLNIWYNATEELEFQLEHGAEVKPGPNTWYKKGKEYHPGPQGLVNLHQVTVQRDTESGGGLRNLIFEIIPPTDTTKFKKYIEMPWKIRLRNPSTKVAAKYYIWVGPDGKNGTLLGAINDRRTLSDSACAKSVLTVGACEKRIPPDPRAGEIICTYSGAGPTLDGRIKPEIVAVGGSEKHLIYSAKSDQKSGYKGDWGTSMAAPLVAGAVALLFDEQHSPKRRYLDNDTIKAMLTQTANRKGLHIDPRKNDFIEKEQNQYGHGRLRMIAPIDFSAPLVDVDVWMKTASDDYGREPYIGGCFCGAPDIQVTIPGSGAGKEVTQLTWGQTYSVIVTIRNLGNSEAVDTVSQLKYALPCTATDTWITARNSKGRALKSRKFAIPALNKVIMTFEWCPKRSDFKGSNQQIPQGQKHFCLLTLVDHPLDKLDIKNPGKPGGDAWALNIKGTNNIALQNVMIKD